MSWLSQGIGWIGDHLGGGGHTPPVPGKFAPLPVAQSPVAPTSASSNAQTSQIEAQLRSQYGVGDVLDAIKGKVGDVGQWIIDHFPSLLPAGAVDANGDIDWGKVGVDAIKGIGNFFKENKDSIIQGLSAYNQYQRQQQADKWTKEALDLAKQSYADKAPLRVAGQAGMLNAGPNDLSSLKSKVPTPTVAPLPVAGSRTNLNNANGIAAGGSGNPFAPKSPAGPAPLPVAGGSSTPGTPSGGGYGGQPSAPPSGIPLGGGVSFTPRTPTPLPIASGTPQNPQMPAHYLQNGLDTDASGNATPGGYNALSDLYKQLGTSPGSVGDPRILAMAKANPKLIDALPVADAETLRHTMASVGA